MKKQIKFKFLSHTGDIKFQAYGKTKPILFQNCALAVAYHFAKGGRIKPKIKKKISIKGEDDESLLYNFLEKIIYLLDAEDFVTAKAKVKIENKNLDAILYGDKTKNYEVDPIKSPTYHDMYIKKTKVGWRAQLVLDV